MSDSRIESTRSGSPDSFHTPNVSLHQPKPRLPTLSSNLLRSSGAIEPLSAGPAPHGHTPTVQTTLRPLTPPVRPATSRSTSRTPTPRPTFSRSLSLGAIPVRLRNHSSLRVEYDTRVEQLVQALDWTSIRKTIDSEIRWRCEVLARSHVERSQLSLFRRSFDQLRTATTAEFYHSVWTSALYDYENAQKLAASADRNGIITCWKFRMSTPDSPVAPNTRDIVFTSKCKCKQHKWVNGLRKNAGTYTWHRSSDGNVELAVTINEEGCRVPASMLWTTAQYNKYEQNAIDF